MPLLLLAIVAMLIQQTMATVAKTAVPVLFPAIALDLGIASELVLGYTWVYACVGMLVMAGCGAFIIRYGAIRMSQVGGLVMAAGLALAAAASEPLWLGIPALLLGAVLISAGSTSATPASSQILARHAPPRTAPLVFSIKQTGVPAGIAIAGGLVLPLAVWIGWQWAAVVVAMLCALITIGLEPCRKAFDAERKPDQKLAFGDLWETLYAVLNEPALRAMAMAAFAFVGLQSIFVNFTVVYLYEELSYTAVTAGAILSLATLVAVPARIFWGVVASTLVPPRVLLGILALFMAAGGATMGAFTPAWSEWAVTLVCLVVSASAVSWHGVLLSEVARAAPEGEAGRMTGGVMAFGSVGQIAYPLLFGAVYFLLGYQAAYLAIGVPVLAVAIALLRQRRAIVTARPVSSD
ncbi:MAG: MFS transporter [Alphaproteobacteria bacterium]|nr:MFS transporter [Alphaproteobacteria bacterium]